MTWIQLTMWFRVFHHHSWESFTEWIISIWVQYLLPFLWKRRSSENGPSYFAADIFSGIKIAFVGEEIMESGTKQGLVGVSLKDWWRSCSLCCSNLLLRWTYAVQPPEKQTVCGRCFLSQIQRSFSKPSLSAVRCTTSSLVYDPKGSSVNHHAGLREAASSGWDFSKLG